MNDLPALGAVGSGVGSGARRIAASLGKGSGRPPVVRSPSPVDGEIAGGNRPSRLITSEGTANSAAYQDLKRQLVSENLNSIARQDIRLFRAVNGWKDMAPNKRGEVNFSIGSGTSNESERLGKIWVGDGYRRVDNPACKGCLISADSTRLYRPPTQKPNTPSQFNPTGIQANFVIKDQNGKTISNGHLNIND